MKKKSGLLASVMLVSLSYGAYANCGNCEKHESDKSDASCPAGVCAVTACPAKDAAVKPAEPKIGVAELATLLKSGVKLTVVDARTGKWDDGLRVPGAKSLHAGSDAKDIASTLPDKKGLVITYCANVKCGAGPALVKRLKELGYENIIEFKDGIEGWAEAGQTVEKTVTK